MNKYHTYPPFLINGKNKREEIRQYFYNSYELFEKIFDLLKDDIVFYKRSELTRHPMIFYFGHTATFFINKLILSGVITKRINPFFESIFAVGVDEMAWDDLNEQNYQWPSVDEVRRYRKQVKDVVDNLISTLPLSFGWNDPFWIILMGIEHERIHIETSSVLHRQMPIKFIKHVDDFKIADDMSKIFPTNLLVKISGATLSLGKKIDNHYYGWDNEYGTLTCKVQDFYVSKFLVSNGEFLEFVLDNGYKQLEFWDDEGKKFLNQTKATHPPFWIKDNDTFRYRTLSTIIDLPYNWPVEVNALEAKAFCAYISKRDGVFYALPNEAQWFRMYEHARLTDNLQIDDKRANINLSHFISPCSVDRFEFNGIFDVIGNVWQWSDTTIDGFKGFKVHPAYDDFSTPTFDNKHNLIKGGSFISTGNEATKYARYAFRRHFFQHAGFRYIKKDNVKKASQKNIYESDELVSQYCEFQYGKEYFGVKNFATKCIRAISPFIDKKKKALDLGCATGRATFELGKYFDKVEGIDFSARFIAQGINLRDFGYLAYKLKEEGDLYCIKKISLDDFGYDDITNKISFWQGDACNLKPIFTSYDLVMATNLIDRVYNPKLFLDLIKKRINKNGLLVLTSPYTWQQASTDKKLWLGGYEKNGEEVKTLNTLKELLKDEFTLIHLQDIPFVIRETARKFQHTISQMSIWRKNEI